MLASLPHLSHAKMRRFLIFFLVYNAFPTNIDGKILRKDEHFHARFTIVTSSSKIVSASHFIGKFDGVTVHQCANKCILYVECVSFNFQSSVRQCEIFSISKFDAIDLMTKKEGWTHYETDVNEKKIGPVCEALSPCKDYEVCEDNYERSGYVCKCQDWYEEEFCTKYVGPGTSPENRAASCKLLRDQFKSIPEGSYWLKGKAEKVFCNGRVNGEWSVWQTWQPCEVSCGSGTQRRMRECNNPLPKLGGRYCDGKDMQVKDCSLEACPLKNIALLKPASQSSTFKPANLGNDGDILTYTMTDLKGKDPWWEVDLEKPAEISKISIRINAGFRKSLTIQTKLNGNGYVLCGSIEAPEKKLFDIQCTIPTNAQYVRLTETKLNYLDLFELEVYGTYN